MSWRHTSLWFKFLISWNSKESRLLRASCALCYLRKRYQWMPDHIIDAVKSKLLKSSDRIFKQKCKKLWLTQSYFEPRYTMSTNGIYSRRHSQLLQRRSAPRNDKLPRPPLFWYKSRHKIQCCARQSHSSTKSLWRVERFDWVMESAVFQWIARK